MIILLNKPDFLKNQRFWHLKKGVEKAKKQALNIFKGLKISLEYL